VNRLRNYCAIFLNVNRNFSCRTAQAQSTCAFFVSLPSRIGDPHHLENLLRWPPLRRYNPDMPQIIKLSEIPPLRRSKRKKKARRKPKRR